VASAFDWGLQLALKRKNASENKKGPPLASTNWGRFNLDFRQNSAPACSRKPGNHANARNQASKIRRHGFICANGVAWHGLEMGRVIISRSLKKQGKMRPGLVIQGLPSPSIEQNWCVLVAVTDGGTSVPQ